MSLTLLAIILSSAGVLVTGALAALFLRDPENGLEQTSHRADKLPQVMADRYVAFTILAVGATVYGDMKVVAVLFTAFAFMRFADAWIYARSGHPFGKHVGAGVAASIVVAVAGMALVTDAKGI